MRAMLWEKLDNNAVHCTLCAHGCRLKPGATGRCGVRLNVGGRLETVAADIVTSLAVDPVEKKPLYHFLPGSRIFSVGGAGCNFSCRFCQNASIAAVDPKSVLNARRIRPESLVRLAEENRCPSIGFTYNEPTVFFEQAYESFGLARARGLRTVLVTNGFFGQDMLPSLAKRVDAANIDLKGFSDSFYRKYCGGALQPVLDNLIAATRLGWWVEVTTLVIPGVNDSRSELEDMAAFVARELGPDTPWHVSGFHGAHLMAGHPSTPSETMEAAWHIGRDAGIRHVYIGNAASSLGSNTICPECGRTLIERRGYKTRLLARNGVCPGCRSKLAGVF